MAKISVCSFKMGKLRYMEIQWIVHGPLLTNVKDSIQIQILCSWSYIDNVETLKYLHTTAEA